MGGGGLSLEMAGRGRRSGNEFMIPVATLSPLTRMIPALRWAAVRDILMGDEVTRQCPQTTEKPFGRERYPEPRHGQSFSSTGLKGAAVVLEDP